MITIGFIIVGVCVAVAALTVAAARMHPIGGTFFMETTFKICVLGFVFGALLSLGSWVLG